MSKSVVILLDFPDELPPAHFHLRAHVILLVPLFWPLHANYSRRGVENGEPFSLPGTVIGIFSSSTNSPSTAATLAVENFNIANPGIEAITYKHLFPDYFENSTEAEISTALQNSVIVTGDPLTCEQLSEIVSNINSYLICYGPATPSTLENLESTSNLYLSQQNPKAFVPCLFSLIELLHVRHRLTSSSEDEVVGEEGEEKGSYPLTVSLLLDQTHPSSVVQKTLFRNLSGKKIRVNISWLEEESGCFSPNLNETLGNGGLHVVVAALYEFDAESLLCAIHRRRCSGQNVILVLLSGGVGLPSKQWLKNVKESDHVCQPDELLAAAEGHFLLEFPSWEIANDRNTKIIRRQLDHKLLENGERFRFHYDQAPLAYDSVWAVIQAISRANANFPPNGNSHHNDSMKLLEFREVVAEELTNSFNGISGEMSFNGKRMRNGNSAVIIMNRFENGSYVEIGKHFNSNSSFPISKSWLGKKDEWNCTWGTTHPECTSSEEDEDEDEKEIVEEIDERRKAEGRRQIFWIPLVCLGFMVLAVLSAYVIFISTKKWCKRKACLRVAPSLE